MEEIKMKEFEKDWIAQQEEMEERQLYGSYDEPEMTAEEMEG